MTTSSARTVALGHTARVRSAIPFAVGDLPIERSYASTSRWNSGDTRGEPWRKPDALEFGSLRSRHHLQHMMSPKAAAAVAPRVIGHRDGFIRLRWRPSLQLQRLYRSCGCGGSISAMSTPSRIAPLLCRPKYFTLIANQGSIGTRLAEHRASGGADLHEENYRHRAQNRYKDRKVMNGPKKPLWWLRPFLYGTVVGAGWIYGDSGTNLVAWSKCRLLGWHSWAGTHCRICGISGWG